jgi:hypothetical protein
MMQWSDKPFKENMQTRINPNLLNKLIDLRSLLQKLMPSSKSTKNPLHECDHRDPKKPSKKKKKKKAPTLESDFDSFNEEEEVPPPKASFAHSSNQPPPKGQQQVLSVEHVDVTHWISIVDVVCPIRTCPFIALINLDTILLARTIEPSVDPSPCKPYSLLDVNVPMPTHEIGAISKT